MTPLMAHPIPPHTHKFISGLQGDRSRTTLASFNPFMETHLIVDISRLNRYGRYPATYYCRNLDKTRKLHSKNRDKEKSVSGSIIQKLGKVQAVMYDGSLKIPLHLNWLLTGGFSV
jgi:hypothetical protein